MPLQQPSPPLKKKKKLQNWKKKGGIYLSKHDKQLTNAIFQTVT